MAIQSISIKSRQCAELSSQLNRAHRDRHSTELRMSAKRNEITRKEGEIIRQESQIASLENATRTTGGAGRLPVPVRVVVGVVGTAARGQLIAAKQRLEHLRSIDLPRLKAELHEMQQQLDAIDANINGILQSQRQHGCA